MQTFRQTLRAYERERTERVLYRMRGQDPGAPSPAQRQRAAWLQSDAAGEVLERTTGDAGTPDATTVALVGLRARLWARGAVVEAEVALRQAFERVDASGDSPFSRYARTALTDTEADRRGLARDVLGPLAGTVLRLADAHVEAAERFPEAYPVVSEADRSAAVALLTATDALAETLVRELTAPVREGREVSWHALARGLRQEAWDGPCRPSDRFRRLAEPFAQVGLSRHLGRRLRVERVASHGLERPVLVRDLPRDIRVCDRSAPGLTGELLGRCALGRALAWSLTDAAVPFEHAYPGWGGPGPVVGGLLMGWMGDAGYWKSLHGRGGADGQQLARVSALMVLLRTRLTAARIAFVERGRDGRERLEARCDGLSRALACSVPPTLAGLLWSGHPAHRDAALGDMGGLAWHLHLRETLDEDCYRNPRLGDTLRATCEPGLRADLGAELGHGAELGRAAAARLSEMLA